MADRERRVPSAAFSGLSATNVLLGWTWPQLLVVVAGIAMVVLGGAGGFNVPVMLLGVVVGCYGGARFRGLSLMSRTAIWLRWRRRVKLGQTGYGYSPLAAGRTVGLLGLPFHMMSRIVPMQVGEVMQIVGTEFADACYLWDPDTRQATAVLRVDVNTWNMSSFDEKVSRSTSESNMLRELADMKGLVQIGFHAMKLRGDSPSPPSYVFEEGVPEWVRQDLEGMWTIPMVLTPFAHLTWVSLTVNVDAAQGLRGSKVPEKVRVARLLAERVKIVASMLRDCGVRTDGVHDDGVRWASLEELRDLIGQVASFGDSVRRVPAGEDVPTVMWLQESVDRVRVDSCVAMTEWISQWPSKPVPAGWLSDLLAERRGIAIAHIYRPKDLSESERGWRRRKSSQEQRDQILKDRPKNAGERDEEKELAQRGVEHEHGFPDVLHQGYVTLLGKDDEELERFDRELRTKCAQYKVRLEPMRGQQIFGFSTMMPFGL